MWPQTTMPALDGVDSGLLEEAPGASHGLLVGDLVAHEGHVADDEGLRGAAAHGLAVHDALVHGHGHRAAVAVDAHPQRVADEDHVDAGGLLEGGRGVVVGGQPGDLLAGALHLV
jgi:hypothetical protein